MRDPTSNPYRVPCSMGCDWANPAVIRCELDQGCIALPLATRQDLCLHHAMRSTPNHFIIPIHKYPSSDFCETILQQRFREIGSLPYAYTRRVA